MGDILRLLKDDHEAAKALLNRFDQLLPDGREEYFCEVVQTLVGHEVAEELVVYPVVSKDGSRGAEVADARLAEQAEAEELLADMESDDPSSLAFVSKFHKLRDAVLAHAQAEESTAFPLLKASTSREEQEELGARYVKAKETAPTHPHPHIPDTGPANKVLGPIAAIFDRARDAAHQR